MNYNEKLYKGFGLLVELAKTPDKRLNEEEKKIYREIKQQFRYPGEMLEQFRNKGYQKKEDLTGLLYAMVVNKGLLTDTMFTGSQEDDFLRRASEEAKDNPLQTYLLWKYKKKGNPCLTKQMDMEPKDFLELLYDIYELLYRRGSRDIWEDILDIDYGVENGAGLVYLLNQRPGIPAKLHEILPVCYENLDLYAVLMELAVIFAKSEELCTEWKKFFSCFSRLYTETMKENSPCVRKLEGYGYSYLEILDLNCGVFETERYNTRAYYLYPFGKGSIKCLHFDSCIKTMRLRKLWLGERFSAMEEVPDWIKNIFLQILSKDTIGQTVDGTCYTKEFFLRDMPVSFTNRRNEFFFLKLCMDADENRRRGESSYLESRHSLGISSPEQKKFLSGFLAYLEDGERNDALRKKLICLVMNNEFSVDEPAEKFLERKALFEEVFHISAYGDQFLFHSVALKNNEIALYMLNHKLSKLEDLGSTQDYIKKEFLRKCCSPYAYRELVKFYQERIELPYDGFSQIREMQDLMDAMPELTEEFYDNRKDIFTKEQLRSIAEMSLEVVFRTSSVRAYENRIVYYLSSEKIRSLYPDGGKELYEAIASDPRAWVKEKVRPLDKIFLKKEEQEKKELELQRQKEAKEKQEQEEQFRALYKKYKAPLSDKPLEKQLELFFTLGIDFRDQKGKVFLAVFHEFLEQSGGTIKVKREDQVRAYREFLKLYRDGSFSYEKMKKAFDLIKEEIKCQ